jgi:enolase-phosphatase E1
LSGPLARAPRAVLLDVEGTVGSIDFVRQVLFPYARSRLGAFVREHFDDPDVAADLAATAREADLPPTDIDALVAVLEQWSDQDRKVTPLKSLQGRIWAAGYRAGELEAHLYGDAASAIRRWHDAGRRIHIYSSGSVQAQKLYFRYTRHGDLSSCIDGYFDTTTGAKQSPVSYQAIAAAVGLAAAEILFLSDSAAELKAAAAAGLKAVQARRGPEADADYEPHVTSFDELGF